jgi:RNA polymerase sigma-70 factor (ECF subfamily)
MAAAVLERDAVRARRPRAWAVIDGAAAPPAEPDDWTLLATCRTDRGALELLYRRHRDYVFRVACGLLGDRVRAEDAMQEVYARIAGKRSWFVPRAQFRTWLYRVTLNVTREDRRASARFPAPPDGHDAIDEHPRGAAERDTVLTELQRALGELPARQREVVVLRYLEGLSTTETAAVLGCREGTVKAHLHRAALALETRLGAGARGLAAARAD